jgi:hypothetical protein
MYAMLNLKKSYKQKSRKIEGEIWQPSILSIISTGKESQACHKYANCVT